MKDVTAGDSGEKSERREVEQKGPIGIPDELFERLLLPVSDEADAEAVCTAIRPYVDVHEAELVAVHVIEKTKGYPDKAPLDARREQADAISEIVRKRFADGSAPVRFELRYGTSVVDEIIATADDVDATAIGFTPKSGNRWIKLLAGDHGTKLVTKSDVPIVAFPHPDVTRVPGESESGSHSHAGDDRDRRVLVPIDGSDPSLQALGHACAAYPTAEITVLHVFRPSNTGVQRTDTDEGASDFERLKRMQRRERRQNAEQVFDEVKRLAAEHDVEPATVAVSGDVTRGILAYAEDHAFDHIVIGSSGRSSLTRLLLGSTAEGVLRRATVPITVVPAREGGETQTGVNHVFIPIDASSTAVGPVTYVGETFPRAKCTVGYLIDPAEEYAETQGQPRDQAERWQERTENRMAQTLKGAVRLADEYDIECSTTTLLGTAPRAVVRYAEGHDVDHIVVKRQGRPPLGSGVSGRRFRFDGTPIVGSRHGDQLI